MEVVLIFAVAFVPSLIAVFRKHRNRVSIFQTQMLLALLPVLILVSVDPAGLEQTTKLVLRAILLLGLVCWVFTLVWALSNRDLAMQLLQAVRKFLGAVRKLIGIVLIVLGCLSALVGILSAYESYDPAFGKFLLGIFVGLVSLGVARVGLSLFEGTSSDKDKRDDSEVPAS